jgi:hypothetical protein
MESSTGWYYQPSQRAGQIRCSGAGIQGAAGSHGLQSAPPASNGATAGGDDNTTAIKPPI